MIVREADPAQLQRWIVGPGLGVRTGAISVRVATDVAELSESLRWLYQDYPLLGPEAFCDHSIRIERARGIRRHLRPQVQFKYDHHAVFEPMPAGHALPLMEWSLNWCVSQHAHQFLIIHAAVLERAGHAAILPAPPGSGKSTLCAALMHRGWRLLSDELALIGLDDGRLHALARPVSLKNQSIDIIAAYEPSAQFSRRTLDTAKGTVALMRVPSEHLQRVAETAQARWIVFPRYQPGSPPVATTRAKPETVLELGRQAFNYSHVLRDGFQRLCDLVERSDCLSFTYSRLDDGVAFFDELAAGT